MKIIEISTLNKLINLLKKYKDNYIFRGMANSEWRLRTSIDRQLEYIRNTNNNILLNTKQNVLLEMGFQNHFLNKYENKFRKIIKRNEKNKAIIDKKTFMHIQVFLQHYNFPTRLLDFTYDWKKALYFCLETKKEKGDFAVYIINTDNLIELKKALTNNQYLYKTNSLDNNNIINNFYHCLKIGIYIIKLPFFKRIKAQSGLFLVSGRSDYDDFQKQAEDTLTIVDQFIKIKIPSKLRSEVEKYLKRENINHRTLYPIDICELFLSLHKNNVIKIFHKVYTNSPCT